MEDITFEKIDIIRERMDVSYSVAKEALEQNNGIIINTLIYLEKSRSNKTCQKNISLSNAQKSDESKMESEKNNLTFILNSIIEDPSIPQEKKVFLIIHSTSLICAIVAVQPLPFADIFVLTPIQLLMVNYLNKALGSPYEKSKTNEILTSLLGIIGWGVLAQHLIIGAYKTFIPYIAGVTTIPMVYAATWALGTGAKTLIEAKKNDRKVSDNELKILVQKAKEEAKKEKGSISFNSFMKEIQDLKENSKEFENYKRILRDLEEKLTDIGIYDANKCKDEIILNTNINDIYQKKYDLLDKRIYSKYKKLLFSDQAKNIFAMIPPNVLLGEVEPVISQINYDISKLSVSKIADSNNMREIDTSFGIIHTIIKGEIIYIQFIELNDNLRSKTILIDYIDAMKVSQSNKLLKDRDIWDILSNTLKSAKKEIDIISPWASYKVMNSIKYDLQSAINRGVTIKILYGIGNYSSINQKESGYSREETTEKVLTEYERCFQSSNLFKIKKSNTHIKLLICDNSYYVQGSYNFLSFKGTYDDSDTRSELALYSESKEEIQELKNAFFSFN